MDAGRDVSNEIPIRWGELWLCVLAAGLSVSSDAPQVVLGALRCSQPLCK